MTDKPIVSICCITYNHEKFISDAIEGFLMQEVDFPIEIIIHDDASSDSTQNIILGYAKKDNRIIPILREENIKSTGVPIFPIVFEKARGKFLALCEGDDYWTDPLKLQKQVEFMEENKDCTICFHPAEHKYEEGLSKNYIHRPNTIPKNKKFTNKDAIIAGGGFITTNTMFFRAGCIEKLPDWLINAPVGDWPLVLLLASKGKIGYIDEIMSVYRKGVKMSWSQESRTIKKRITLAFSIIEMLLSFNANTDYKYTKQVFYKVFTTALNLPKVIGHIILHKIIR